MDIWELIKKANEGDAKSQYELAMRYIDGDGVSGRAWICQGSI